MSVLRLILDTLVLSKEEQIDDRVKTILMKPRTFWCGSEKPSEVSLLSIRSDVSGSN